MMDTGSNFTYSETPILKVLIVIIHSRENYAWELMQIISYTAWSIL